MSKIRDAIRAATDYHVDMVSGDVYGKSGNLLKGTVAANGYVYITLVIKGITRSKGQVVPKHALIAFRKYGEAAFADGFETRHKDGNHLNNIPDNILIGTRSDNMMDMTAEARSDRNKNKPSKKRKLSIEAVEEIQRIYENGLIRGQCTELAQKFGVNPTTISEIGTRKTYNA